MRTRPAVPDDAEAVGAVLVAAGTAAWSEILDPARLDGSPGTWSRAIAEQEAFWVCEDGSGAVVGFAAAGPASLAALEAGRGVPGPATPAARLGELHLLHVHPDAWGSGAAGLLHEAAVTHLRATGRCEAVLRTEERNARALSFYRQAGWRPDGTAHERELDGVRLREPWLRLPLAPVLLPFGGHLGRRRELAAVPSSSTVRVVHLDAGDTVPAARAAGDRPEAPALVVACAAGEAWVASDPGPGPGPGAWPRAGLVGGHAVLVPARLPAVLGSDTGAVLFVVAGRGTAVP